MNDNEQLKCEFTDDERRRLVDYFSLQIEMDQQEKARYAKLKDSPKGFPLDDEGRQCGLCFKSIYDTPGWFDKWGFKCSNCQDAVNKRKIPGSLCGDYRHEKSIPNTVLVSKLNLSVRTIRKKIKDGEIIGRRIPDGPYMVLQKDNPRLTALLRTTYYNGVMLDYYDIETWKPGLKKYTDSISRTPKTKNKSPKFKSVDLSAEELITREVYALLNSKLDTKPNGMMTRLQRDNMPLNSLWWWDFTFESDIGSISILKGNTSFEAQLFLNDKSFDIVKFLKNNLTKYSEIVDETIGTYELHRTYINHYQSYKTTTRHLYDKIQALDLTKPAMPKHSDATGESVKAFVDSLQQYTINSVEYHVLGKSLLLHSAFMAETFINLLIRVGASSTIREQKHLLNLHLNSNFETKLRNLNVLCMYTTGGVEVNSDPVKNILEVMTMRNKYVHGDESSRLNRLDDVYFDELFPLYDLDSNNIAINSIQNTYHNPPRQDVERAYESASAFIEYVSSLIHPDAQYEIGMIMEQNPIGYNSKTHKYSVIYPTAMAFGMPVFGKD